MLGAMVVTRMEISRLGNGRLSMANVRDRKQEDQGPAGEKKKQGRQRAIIVNGFFFYQSTVMMNSERFGR
jgi:hypothetical protein